MPPSFPSAAVLAATLFCSGALAQPSAATGYGPLPQLPPPESSLVPTINIAPAKGWSGNAAPVPAAGLSVTAFARDLDHPRWLYVLPNGDVLVAETNRPPREGSGGFMAWVKSLFMKRAGAETPSANRISLLRDSDGDGVAEVRHTFLSNLYSPFGMVLVDQHLYVANADALLRFPYEEGQTSIDAAAEKLADLPAGKNHHWTKNVVASRDGRKLYVAVGSNSNIAEGGMEIEEDRAAILEIDAKSGERRLFASGLRNPVGMAWEPHSGVLWTSVNERDELGDNLVPDYMTSVQDGDFYGWPYSYFGQNVDDRVEPRRPELVAQAIMPDYALGNHTSSLGLCFAEGARLPAPFTEGAFVGQHGSWNRKEPSGYKVIFVPFRAGKPDGMPIDVLTGFLDEDGNAQGRPVGVSIDRRGGLLVADDVGNVIWRVSAADAPGR